MTEKDPDFRQLIATTLQTKRDKIPEWVGPLDFLVASIPGVGKRRFFDFIRGPEDARRLFDFNSLWMGWGKRA